MRPKDSGHFMSGEQDHKRLMTFDYSATPDAVFFRSYRVCIMGWHGRDVSSELVQSYRTSHEW